MSDAWRRYRDQVDWVQEVFYLALLAMEACLIHPWQALLHALLGYEGLPFWALLALLWVSFLAAGLLNRSGLAADRKQAIVAAVLILSALTYIRLFVYADRALWQLDWIGDMANQLFSFDRIPRELLMMVLVFIGWWRGIVAARRGYDTPAAWFHFRVGVIMLFGYLLITIFGHRTDATLLLLGFFFFGLISIALARILELGGIQASTLGSRRWIAFLAGSTLGSLGLGLLATLIFSRQTLRTVLGWFQPLGRMIGWVAWTLASMVLYLIFPLLEWAMGWVTQMADQGGEEGEALFGSPLFSPLQLAQEEGPAPQVATCRTILVVLIVTGGLFLVARLIRKLAEPPGELENLERESLFSGADVLDGLRKGLRERLDQIRSLAGQFGGRHHRSIASIRKIYASMVDLATEAGYPRRAAETPYEYCDTLYGAFPGGDEAVNAITEAYVRTHYGEVPDTPEKMQRIVQQWQQLQMLVAPKPEQEGP